MPKKQNAYELFVRDNFHRLQRDGKKPIYPNLFGELGPKWKNLSDAERQRYKDRAKQPAQEWSRDRPAPGSHSNPVSLVLNDSRPTSQPASASTSTSTNQGSHADNKPYIDMKPIINNIAERKVNIKRSHDEIDWDDDDSEQVAQNEKKVKLGIPNQWGDRIAERYRDINLVKIRESCKAIIASRAKSLISMPIYSFSVNVLCYKRDVGKFVPIEIGICAYSLKAGRLGQPYHALIDAGPPLDGCVNLAADHAATHKITIPPKDAYPRQARKDYRKIYREIVDYIKAGERTILVWDAREMQQVVGSLEWLYEKAIQQNGPGKIPKVSTWTVLPVMEFSANMANFVHQSMLGNKEPVFVVHYYINMLLETSIFDYEKDYMCDYHKGVESKWCARSCAIRMFLNIEKHFEVVCKGFEQAVNPAFLKAKMKPQPILYHEHRPAQQFLSDRANPASSSANQIDSNQQLAHQEQQQPLALPAPERLPQLDNDDNPVRMTTEGELHAPANGPEIAPQPTPTLLDPRIRA